MDKLIQEQIGDRLLELSKYSLSKRIIVDKITLSQDGYQLVPYQLGWGNSQCKKQK